MRLEDKVIEERNNLVSDYSLDLNKILEGLKGRHLPYVEQISKSVEYVTNELGLDVKVFEKFPQLFGLSIEDNLKPKVEYVTDELGLDVKVFEKLPTLFNFSLNKRIKPRTAFLEKKGKHYGLLSHIGRSDSVFCSRIIKCPLEEYEQFKEDYIKLNS